MVSRRQRLGAFGERVARAALEREGYVFAEANVRLRPGEIDLVMRDGDEWVLVEVRTRRAAPGAAAESVGPAKLRRLWRCAEAFASARDVSLERIRVELVCVELDTAGRVTSVEHFRHLEFPEDDAAPW